MIIQKVINNNIIASVDEAGCEIIVMGRGLGFGVKAGQSVDEKKVEKIFRMETEEETNQLADLLNEVPIERVEITNEIIDYANTVIETELNKTIYITLTDHINFAIERYQQNIQFANQLCWEIKRFYPKEYKIGQKAVELLSDRLDLNLVEDEAASIAMHFVNAELKSGRIEQTVQITKIIQNSLTIVKYHYRIELDETSLDYARFVTHMKFFAQRMLNGTKVENLDDKFCMLIERQYPNDYKCAGKIADYIFKEYGYQVPDEEKMYLTLHIKRVVLRK
ncbi:BglG family transcription antiterminator LicT [Hespellia stercorisuis]|uniref:Transcriptional antiterminator, BglG family n=1 Tax=Hespellia stercorisuis DSM 15480 TaxID=1121950 RepID=A0A1M6JMN8_9FIRM|nr:PRD domain-containing protein [Hespellia stercorisuis]SHJ47995.1 transcriptional antiterminator, BglG family [Hespellia stercorisuis DSM 15480]